MKRILLAIALLIATIGGVHPVLAQQACGTERWAVKTGTDSDASQINLTPTQTTIAELGSLPEPRTLPERTRLSPTETTVWVVSGTLVEYKLETDSDYHLVIEDDQGNSMITEIPLPDCVGSSSPFGSGIANARSEFDAQFSATDRFQSANNIPVQVTGVGFFDRPHGQSGHAPNFIELHPVLDIQFNPQPGSTPLPQATTVQATSVPSGPPGQQWQYQVVTAPSAEALTSKLNSLGAQGWELVSVVFDGQNYIAFLKRASGASD